MAYKNADLKPEITREVLDEVDNMEKALSTFRGFRLIDAKIWNRGNRDHTYGNHCTTDAQVKELQRAIFYALRALEKLQESSKNPDYCPHQNYMRRPETIPTTDEKLEYQIAIEGLLKIAEGDRPISLPEREYNIEYAKRVFKEHRSPCCRKNED